MYDSDVCHFCRILRCPEPHMSKSGGRSALCVAGRHQSRGQTTTRLNSTLSLPTAGDGQLAETCLFSLL